MPNELPGAKNETVLLMQCYADLFQGAAAGLIRLNNYRTFLGIYPTYRCKSTQGIVYFGGTCRVGGSRLTQVYLGMHCPRDETEPCFRTLL